MIGVAISGKLCSGKTTAANALIREMGFERVPLAEPLKWAAAEIADWLEQTFDPGRASMGVLWSRDQKFLSHDDQEAGRI